MLYDLRETIVRAWQPWRDLATAPTGRLRSEAAQGRPPSRTLLAGYEFVERLTRQYEKPEFGLTSTVIDGEPVAVRERHVYTKPFAELIHFARDGGHDDPRVLVLPP